MSKITDYTAIADLTGYYGVAATESDTKKYPLLKSGLPFVLAQSAVAVSVTGTLVETTLATITIPGGCMGANGRLRLTTGWTVTNSGNAKTLKAYLNGTGGTAYMSVGLTASVSLERITNIANRNSQSSQVGSATNAANPLSATTTALTTSAIDMSTDKNLVITGTLANSGETITLEHYLLEVMYKV